MEEHSFVLVTTDKDKRGVFGGYLKEDNSPNNVILEEARMVVYWSENVKSVLGLASIGPQDGCKISLPVTEIKIFGVTSITICTKEAIKQWEKDIWS